MRRALSLSAPRLAATTLLGGLLVGLLSAAPDPAEAQLLSTGGDEPIEVNATESLEWRAEENAYIARGDAQVVQGGNSLAAQTITAYFAQGDAEGGGEGGLGPGSTSITRVVAEGGVRIVSGTDRAFAARGVYDVPAGRMTLTGNPRIESAEGTITAGESIDYQERERVAVATGGAEVVRGEDRLQADRLEAQLVEGANSGFEVSSVRAIGNVVITSPSGRATAAEATYSFETEVAMLTGNVTVTQGQNHLTGAAAEVNLANGVSRLLAGEGEGGRVRGLLVPQ